MELEITLFFILIILSAFFSGSETALLALNRLRLHHQVRKKKPKAALLERTIRKPDQFIGTVLVGNNLVNVACASIATGLAIDTLGKEKGMIVATVVTTLILLIFAETIPKTYAALTTEKTAYRIIYPIRFCLFLFYPLVKFVTGITNTLLSLLGVRDTYQRLALSEEELKTLINVSHTTGTISKEKEEMLQSVFNLDVKKVKDILTPRNQIVSVEINDKPEKIKALLEKKPYSRLPVYSEKKNNIVGILYTKDFLKKMCETNEFEIKSLMREPSYVPELQNVRHLVKHFQKSRSHVSIVVNEYGEYEGLVTLEDALEEIVGEIYDEYDSQTSQVQKLADGSCLVMSHMKIEDINNQSEWTIKHEQLTVGALLADETDRIPGLGEVIKYGGFEFTILSTYEQRIGLVKIKKVS